MLEFQPSPLIIKYTLCFTISGHIYNYLLAAFDVNKLWRMTEFYLNDLIDVSEVALRHQLKNYVTNV
ncbi:transmembrane protein, putative [Medicago truncatula]|uniref:Transmembrane protein, putative n=1 Tax=Medicago truncatula TaxID=3880 RepID=G7IKY3_MEDTR|nr:transmembrane protein, putative [Medicago truncatula]